MANQEHLDLLKQGVETWNQWYQQHAEPFPNLCDAKLSGFDLRRVYLRHANLNHADLSGADLRRADLSDAYLNYADLSGANLGNANLRDATLNHANLRGAALNRANLSFARLSGADLSGADLYCANLSYAYLDTANLSHAIAKFTLFTDVDLRKTKGLAEIEHQAPSAITLNTIQLPQDGSALVFLRGAGIPDEWIGDYRARLMHPIQYHSCFISYSSRDEPLARRLHADLQAKGVRCWFAPEDMKIGDKIRPRIDEAIHLQDKLLLILSGASVASDWVEHEVEMALAKERKEQRIVLFPIRVDRAILDQEDRGWPALVRHQRHIEDFTDWPDPQAYQIAFNRLLRDLKKADE